MQKKNNNRTVTKATGTNSTRAVLYARVSTRDRQEADNQLLQLREYCRCSGLVIVGEYVDKESGANPDRAQFKAMFEHARQRRFDQVIFWALDRFSREGTRQTLKYLTALEDFGVTYRSHTQAWIDSAGPFRDVVIAIMATLAGEERKLLSERVSAGMERAQKSGKHIGRPAVVVNGQELFEMSRHKTMAQIAKAKGISKATVCRRIVAYEATLPEADRPWRNRLHG